MLSLQWVGGPVMEVLMQALSGSMVAVGVNAHGSMETGVFLFLAWPLILTGGKYILLGDIALRKLCRIGCLLLRWILQARRVL